MQALPKIDTRDFDNLLQEIRKLVPFYTPEWQVPKNRDSGSALLKIFAHLMADTLGQLNQVPQKNFIAFFDMLGVKLLPAQQAKVPVTFSLSRGTQISVLIPERTQVGASARGDDSITFETEKPILATPAKLVAAYSANPSEDSIFSAPPGLLAAEKQTPVSARLVFAAKPNDTSLFLNHASELEVGDRLKIEGSVAGFEYVEVDKISGNKVAIKDKLSFAHSQDALVKKVTVFELFEGNNEQEHVLYLGHKDAFNITGNVQIKLQLSGLSYHLLTSPLVRWEYCRESKDSEKSDWHSFDKLELNNSIIILHKDNSDRIKETEINDLKSRWIRCTAVKLPDGNSAPISRLRDVKLDSIKVTATPFSKEGIATDLSPNMAFYNDVPIDTAQGFYPFGKEPRQFDTFYFASQEAFSSKGVTLTLQFKIQQIEERQSNEVENPTVSWEYWNGKSWNFIQFPEETDKQILNFTKREDSLHEITFICPKDLEPTTINGEEQYWLRIRLIDGDYGREVLRFDAENNESISGFRYNPPYLEDFSISYDLLSNPLDLDHCLTFNNLHYQDQTEESKTPGKSFQPFQPLDAHEALDNSHQALYLGFDAPPLNSPISIFFALELQTYTEKNRPCLNWEYYRLQNGRGEWARLEVRDETFSLTQSGTLEFVGSPDFAKTSRFGKPLYWIRAVDVEDKFKPQEKIQAKPASQRVVNSAQVEFFHPEFLPIHLTDVAPAPQIKGIYLNTTLAAQATLITEEVIGSSNGEANQTFQLVKFPVISEELWVNELSFLAKEDRKRLLEQNSIKVEEIKDYRGNTREFWVKWQPREELLESTATDRHYEIDRTFGQIKFGNGDQGAIPPIGTNNIKANYRVGGGTKGNVGRFQITSLKTSIAYVDRVTNPEAAEGGTDTEPLENALQRGPQMLKHRNRAVTKEDFEHLTYQASRSIARVKCLPNFNDEGQYELGWVTVIVVPSSSKAKPQPSLLLRQQIEKHLRDCAANVVTLPKHLQIVGPVYVEIAIKTTLVAANIEAVFSMEQEAMQKLNAFLHPLTGGYKNRGWTIGRLPCLSDFYVLLGSIPGLDSIKFLSMTVRDTNTGLSLQVTPEQHLDINMPAYALVCSGKHQVTVDRPRFRKEQR